MGKCGNARSTQPEGPPTDPASHQPTGNRGNAARGHHSGLVFFFSSSFFGAAQTDVRSTGPQRNPPSLGGECESRTPDSAAAVAILFLIEPDCPIRPLEGLLLPATKTRFRHVIYTRTPFIATASPDRCCAAALLRCSRSCSSSNPVGRVGTRHQTVLLTGRVVVLVLLLVILFGRASGAAGEREGEWASEGE